MADIVTTNNGYGTANIQFRLTYTVTQNTANNTSTIVITNMEYKSGGNYTGSQWTEELRALEVQFAGVTVSYSRGSATSNKAYVKAINANTWYAVSNFKANTSSGIITHNQNGTKSGTFTVHTYIKNSYHAESEITCTSSTVSLPTINRVFQITYDHGDYSTESGSSVNKYYDESIQLSDAIFTRFGYTQEGWSLKSDGSTKKYDLKATYTDNASVTLYPYWVPITYEIKYLKGSNGSGKEVTDYKTHDVDLTLRGGIFTRTGYTQTGWSETDGGSKKYEIGATYTNNIGITLYPYWEANEYEIIYSPGDYCTGDNIIVNKKHEINKKIQPYGDFLRTGYKQIGWSINSNGSTLDYTESDYYKTNAGIMLYPVWEISTIIRISNGTTIKEYTKLYFSDGTKIYNIIGCYYSDGTSTHHGI